MSDFSKPSGLKPPSRIAKPNGVVSKPNGSVDPVTAAVDKLNQELAKRRLSEVDSMGYVGRRMSEAPRKSSEYGDFKPSRRFSEDVYNKRKESSNPVDLLYEQARRLSEAGIRRGSDANVVLTEDTDSFIIGDYVWVGGTKPGHIQYIGETQFAPGEWAGVVLDGQSGKNDGSVAGVRYFQCEPKRGVFARLTKLTKEPLIPLGEDIPGSAPSSRPSSRKTTPAARDMKSPSPPVYSSPFSGDLKIGDTVLVASNTGTKSGTLRYLGVTEFAPGEWAGVELNQPLGKNDGSVAGKRYFECRPKFGLFAPLHKVTRSSSGTRRSSNALRRGSSKESVASTASAVSTGSARGGRKPSVGTTPRATHNALQTNGEEEDGFY